MINIVKKAVASLAFIAGGVSSVNAQMELPGEFKVNSGGAATYSIPIEVPPGAASMQPKISLEYNSQSGNGLLGQGWSIGGLSAITRCPRTIAQDGVRGSISFDLNDRYCLDGARLVLASGSYGQNGSEYRQELDNFSRVRAYESTDGGVRYFKVQTKSGLSLEFGLTEDSRVEAINVDGSKTAKIKTWAVNRIQDSNGNFIRFVYNKDTTNPALMPTGIAYGTRNGDIGSIAFQYEARADTVKSYYAGTFSWLAARLKKVLVYDPMWIRTYELEYVADAVPNKLASVRMCAIDGKCLTPTSFIWPGASPGFYGEKLVAAHGGGAVNNIAGDFNGDGKTDLAGYAGNGQWHVCLSTGGTSDFDCSSAFWNGPSSDVNTTFTGDFNGDGRTDLANFAGGGVWNVCFAAFRGFSCQSRTYADMGGVSNIVVGDFNGDGRSDVAAPRGSGGDEGAWIVCLSTGSDFLCNYWTGGHALGIEANVVGDFNGDGLTDVAGYAGRTNIGGVWSVCLSTGFNFSCTPQESHGEGKENNVIADFNGDGLSDMAAYNARTQLWEVCLSKGNGFACERWVGHTAGIAANFVGDFNGDGMADIAAPNAQTPGLWAVCLSTRSGFSPCINRLGHGGGFANNIIGDFNGDGRSDLAGYTGAQGQWHLTGSTYEQNYISRIDGQFKSIGISYKSLANAGSTYKSITEQDGIPIIRGGGMIRPGQEPEITYSEPPTAPTRSSYPDIDIQNSQQVVAQVNVTGAISSSALYTYGYLKANQQGRGSLGFWSLSVEDVQPGGSQLRTSTTFNQQWPLTGQAKITEQFAGTRKIALSKYNIFSVLGSVGNSYFVYPSSITEEKWDLSGSALPAASTQYEYSQSPQFGDVIKVVTSQGDGIVKTVTNTYFPADIGGDKWILGRLRRTTVTSERPGSVTIPTTSVQTSPMRPGSDTTQQPVKSALSSTAALSVILDLLLAD